MKILAARYRAAEARCILLKVGLFKCLARNLIGLVVILGLQVAHAQGADLINNIDQDGGAIVLQAGGAHFHRLTDVIEQRLDGIGIRHSRFAAPSHRHGLEVLGTHDGAQAATAGDTVAAFIPGVHGAGKAHEVFASRADGEDFHLTLARGREWCDWFPGYIAPRGLSPV